RLAGLANLKSLTLASDSDEAKTHEWLAALGALTQLERLCLTGLVFPSDDQQCLAGLSNLRALAVRDYWPDSWYDEDGTEEGQENTDELETRDKLQLLAHLPALPRLETIDLKGSA